MVLMCWKGLGFKDFAPVRELGRAGGEEGGVGEREKRGIE